MNVKAPHQNISSIVMAMRIGVAMLEIMSITETICAYGKGKMMSVIFCALTMLTIPRDNSW